MSLTFTVQSITSSWNLIRFCPANQQSGYRCCSPKRCFTGERNKTCGALSLHHDPSHWPNSSLPLCGLKQAFRLLGTSLSSLVKPLAKLSHLWGFFWLWPSSIRHPFLVQMPVAFVIFTEYTGIHSLLPLVFSWMGLPLPAVIQCFWWRLIDLDCTALCQPLLLTHLFCWVFIKNGLFS